MRRSHHLRRPTRPGAALAVLLFAVVGCSSPVPASVTAAPTPSVESATPSPSPSPLSTPSASPGPTAVPTETASPSTSPPSALKPGGEATLAQLLALLTIAPEDRTGYDRSLFRHWIDADGNGCDTRREVLIDEAVVPPVVGGGCSLSGGRWLSLYDGLMVTDASKLQIDHVVALAEAWDSGASAWTADRRMRFANDLDVGWSLIAVSGSSNQSKSDRDPADWVPPDPGDLCPFASAWIAIKVRWDLSVDPRERDALSALVTDCPASRMPFAPVPPSGDETPSATVGGAGCSPAYPNVCIPPPPPDLDCGDVPYRGFSVLPPDPHHFDGDHDGIGCEG